MKKRRPSIDGFSSGQKRPQILEADKSKKIPVRVINGEQSRRNKDASKRIDTAIKSGTDKHADREIEDFLNTVKDQNIDDFATNIEQKKRQKTQKTALKPKKKHHFVRNILLILLVLFCAGLAGVYAYFNNFVAKITDDGNLFSLITSNVEKLKTDQNNHTNILVFGTEGYDMNNPNYDGGFLTDSMMLLNFNQDTKAIKAISLPRDLKTRTCTATGKLNEAYWCEFSQHKDTEESIKEYEEKGSLALQAKIKEILGVDVQYTVHVNWQALVQAINALGGIDVVFTFGDQTWDGPETVIKTSDRRGLADGNATRFYFRFPNGQKVHLSGDEALMVARARNAAGGYGAGGGNFSREYFQQRIIEAMLQKSRANGLDIFTVLKIKDAIGDNMRTNFQDKEIKAAMSLLKDVETNKIESISLLKPQGDEAPLLTTGMINRISYVYPVEGVGKYTKIHAYIDKLLYKKAPEAENKALEEGQ